MANIPAGVVAQQAGMQAPGQGIGQQANATQVAKGKLQPDGKKGDGKAKKPTPAASLYPNLPTQGG